MIECLRNTLTHGLLWLHKQSLHQMAAVPHTRGFGASVLSRAGAGGAPPLRVTAPAFVPPTAEARHPTGTRESSERLGEALPIFNGDYIYPILKAHGEGTPILISAETGSGKTITLVYLAIGQWQKDGHPVKSLTRVTHHSLPTRAAVLSTKAAMDHFCEGEVRGLVGFAQNRKVDYDHAVHPSRVCTSRHVVNALVRALSGEAHDPWLSTSTIVIDEAHYPDATTRVLFLLAKYLTTLYPDGVRVVISSATLDNGQFSDLFPASACATVECKTRTHPITVEYCDHPVPRDAKMSLMDEVAKKVQEIVQNPERTPGSILVFLAGEPEIIFVSDRVERFLTEEMVLLWCYGSMSPEEYDEALADYGEGTWVVILSTNVAETSVTIPNVRYVVDSLRHKRAKATPVATHLIECDVSKATSKQRMGRTGRLCPGVYIPMADKEGFEALPETDPPPQDSSEEHYLFLRSHGLPARTILFPWEGEERAMKDYLGCIKDLASMNLVEVPGVAREEALWHLPEPKVTNMGTRVASYQTGIRPALTLCLAIDRKNVDAVIYTALALAMIEAVDGGDPRFIPKEHRRPAKARADFIMATYGRLDRPTDLGTVVAWFQEMVEAVEAAAAHHHGARFDYWRGYKDWAVAGFWNNRIMSQARSTFESLANQALEEIMGEGFRSFTAEGHRLTSSQLLARVKTTFQENEDSVMVALTKAFPECILEIRNGWVLRNEGRVKLNNRTPAGRWANGLFKPGPGKAKRHALGLCTFFLGARRQEMVSLIQAIPQGVLGEREDGGASEMSDDGSDY